MAAHDHGVRASCGGDGGGDRVVTGPSVKVVVVGDGAVGKTSLLVSFIMNRFPTEHVPTVFANYAKEIIVSEEQVNLWLCDTAGQEEYDRLRVMSYPDTDVFLLCFSVTDPKSLHSVTEKWLPEVRFHTPSAQCVLVATKMDLRGNESEIARLAKDSLTQVSTEQGEKLAFELEADGYMECSSLTQDGLHDVFDFATRLALSPSNKKSVSRKGSVAGRGGLLSRCCFV
ncbi:cdc42 homolog [Littorina saxatilis]|uniref:cdc42 homolog n=1 Tax=Littorina saxatilis TaxID=31220 RepID=UPI0038B41A86